MARMTHAEKDEILKKVAKFIRPLTVDPDWIDENEYPGWAHKLLQYNHEYVQNLYAEVVEAAQGG